MRAKLQDVDEGLRSTAPQRRPAPHRAMTRLMRAAKRLFLEAAGWLMLLAGLAAIPLPGPGLLITFAGLLLLSRQYAWAERRVEWVRLRALEGAAQSVATWPRLTASMVGAVLILAAGMVWIASPPAPTWWPLAKAWWLPGSAVVGVTQLASAVLALALLGYSYGRFPPSTRSVDRSRGPALLRRLPADPYGKFRDLRRRHPSIRIPGRRS